MKLQKHDFLTGVFVLIGLILGIGSILVIVSYNLVSNRVQYTLRLDKLYGIKKGTLIRVKNYTVGEVERVIPIYGTDLTFRADIFIDRDLILYRGTKVNVTNLNVIGDTVIELFPALKGKYRLKEGDTLFATNITNLDEMVSQVSSILTTVNSAIQNFGDMAGNSKGDIKSLLVNLNRSVLKINSILDASQDELILTMKNIRLTSQTLEKFSREIAANPWRIMESKPGSATRGVALP